MFQGNTLRNVVVHFRGPAASHRTLTVSGNDLVFDVASPTAFDALRVGPVSAGGHVLVQGNSLSTQAAQPDGSSGLDVLAASPAAERYLVSGNLVSGWGARGLHTQPETLLQPRGE